MAQPFWNPFYMPTADESGALNQYGAPRQLPDGRWQFSQDPSGIGYQATYDPQYGYVTDNANYQNTTQKQQQASAQANQGGDLFSYAPLALAALAGGMAFSGAGVAGAGAEAAGGSELAAGGAGSGIGGGGGGLTGGATVGDGFDWASLIGDGAPAYDSSLYTTGIDSLSGTGSGVASGLQTMTPELAQQLTSLGYSGAQIQALAGGAGQATLDGLGSGFGSLTSGARSSSTSWLDSLLNGSGTNPTSSILKALLGSNGTGGSKGLLDGALGSNGILGSLLGAAPGIAALSYAANQTPADTTQLHGLLGTAQGAAAGSSFNPTQLQASYDAFNPQAQTSQYDIQTGLGNAKLNSSLAQRGLSGSSFGDQSLTNFSTSRDLGRQTLINQGITSQAGIAQNIAQDTLAQGSLANSQLGTQAGIAKSILDANVASTKNKNDLYGRALLALSGGLSPTAKLGLGGLFS